MIKIALMSNFGVWKFGMEIKLVCSASTMVSILITPVNTPAI